MAHRIEKVEALIKESISNILLYKLNDPVAGFITVTNVKVSADLRNAKIYVSVLEKDKRDATLKKIEDHKGAIRSELAARINLRYVPELRFYIDESLDYAQRINDLLKKIREHDNEENN